MRVYTLGINARRAKLAHRALKTPGAIAAKTKAIEILTLSTVHTEILLTEVNVYKVARKHTQLLISIR